VEQPANTANKNFAILKPNDSKESLRGGSIDTLKNLKIMALCNKVMEGTTQSIKQENGLRGWKRKPKTKTFWTDSCLFSGCC
jgi:hypothetical protein